MSPQLGAADLAQQLLRYPKAFQIVETGAAVKGPKRGSLEVRLVRLALFLDLMRVLMRVQDPSAVGLLQRLLVSLDLRALSIQIVGMPCLELPLAQCCLAIQLATNAHCQLICFGLAGRLFVE